MNKQQFLKELEMQLSRLPKAERDDILSDFVEYFECAAQEGQNEAVLCERLGDPRKLAKEYHAQSVIASANETRKLGSMMRAFVYSAGLGSVNFLYAVFVVGIGYILISVFYIAAVALAAGALVGLAGAVAYFRADTAALWLSVFTAVGLVAAGVLWFIGNMQLAKKFGRANMAFLNKISEKLREARGR